MRPTATAIHEAAHAVAAYCLGRKLGRITVEPNHENGTEGTSQNEPGENPFEEATIYYAGWEAEALRDPQEANEHRQGAEWDNEKALALVGKDAEGCCRAHAREILRNHWDWVFALAVELDRWKTIWGEEAEFIFEFDDAEQFAAELAEYRIRNPQRELSEEDFASEVERLTRLWAQSKEAAEAL